MKRIRRETDRTARQMRDDLALVGTLHVGLGWDETDIRMVQFPLLFAGAVDGYELDYEDASMILEALDKVVSDAEAEAMWDRYYWSADADTLDVRGLFNLAWRHGVSLESWRINPMFAPRAWAHLND